MKKYLITFICFSILTLILFINRSWASGPLSGKVIVLDAGHGGVDVGAVVTDVYEKDINLKITLALKEKLESFGAKVILTRDGDYDLGAPNAKRRKKSDFDHRIKIINQSNADYYLSIHINYLSDFSYAGPQVFYNNEQAENKNLAFHIQDDLNKNIGGNRKVKLIPSRTYMYSRLKIKGVLIECGFLSNAKERQMLLSSEYIDKLTSNIALSLASF